MKILYVCHRIPYPPKRGGKIRPFNMIKHLHASHEVVVASLSRSDIETEEARGLKDFCKRYHVETVSSVTANIRMVANLPRVTPSSMGYFRSPRLAQKIRQELQETNFDLIFVHCSSMAQYVEDVRGIPKILDFGDMDSQKWLEYARYKPFPLKYGYWLEGTKMEHAEKRLAAKFDYCSCTTRAEKETLDSFGVTDKTYWFPNGVDYNFFRPSADSCEPDSLSFIGRMDYYPNQECMIRFCSVVLPELRKTKPNIRLTIVGADPSPEIKRLEQIQGVTVTGSVADVRPYVLRSAVNIAPLNIARGTQNKILEAMAMGVPVVASKAAAGGIDAVAGEHFLVADSDTEYVAAILKLLDPRQRAYFSESGRNRVVSNHDWGASMLRLDELISLCLRETQDKSRRKV